MGSLTDFCTFPDKIPLPGNPSAYSNNKRNSFKIGTGYYKFGVSFIIAFLNQSHIPVFQIRRDPQAEQDHEIRGQDNQKQILPEGY